MGKDEKLEQLREDALKVASKFAKVFSTPDGVEVLEVLKKELNPENQIGEDTHSTYFNLGKRDAFKFIELYIRQGENYDR